MCVLGCTIIQGAVSTHVCRIINKILESFGNIFKYLKKGFSIFLHIFLKGHYDCNNNELENSFHNSNDTFYILVAPSN